MKNGDRLMVSLPLSHFIRGLDKPEERKTEQLLNTEENVERKVVSLSPPDAYKDFSGHFSSLVGMHQCY